MNSFLILLFLFEILTSCTYSFKEIKCEKNETNKWTLSVRLTTTDKHCNTQTIYVCFSFDICMNSTYEVFIFVIFQLNVMRFTRSKCVFFFFFMKIDMGISSIPIKINIDTNTKREINNQRWDESRHFGHISPFSFIYDMKTWENLFVWFKCVFAFRTKPKKKTKTEYPMKTIEIWNINEFLTDWWNFFVVMCICWI